MNNTIPHISKRSLQPRFRLVFNSSCDSGASGSILNSHHTIRVDFKLTS